MFGLAFHVERAFNGSPNGKGAVYAWSGERRAGVDCARMLDVTSPERVAVQLGSNTAEFRLQPIGDSTSVTWSLQGPHPFIGRVLESGLASLKAVAEG